MLEYNRKLKSFSRDLRLEMTIAEKMLWRHLRRKQILGVQFYRQKPLQNYIVDFYAHEPKLAIECDGVQHLDENNVEYDKERDKTLNLLGIVVLRFNNDEVIHKLHSVLEVIWECVKKRT